MSPLFIQVCAGLLLLALVYVTVRKSAVDGFFPTFCTAAVLYAAVRFADIQWQASYWFLVETFDMDSGNAVERATMLSASYWIGFVLVLLPAMLYVKLLTRDPVPFPAWIERGGSFAFGVLCGFLFFGAILTGISRFRFFENHLQAPLNPFRNAVQLVQMF